MEIDALRFVIAFPLLLYAAYSDIKKREADNWIWIVMALFGIPFIIWEKNLFMTAISIGITFPVAFLLYLFGMGGADAKAIMAIAILNPLPPSTMLYHSPMFVFPMTVLLNSLILILPLPLIFLIYNVIRKNADFPYCLFGYKMDAIKAEKKFVWPMEKNGKKSIKPIKNADWSTYHGEIWVTPKLPFLVFILAGYLISYFVGDVLFAFISFILK